MLSDRLTFIEEVKDYNLSFNNGCIMSVIVVTYNAREKLLECLESLTQQTLQDFEIIVVDNGKNFEVVNLLKRYSLKYIKLKKNYFPSFARNVGLFYAKTDVVCFIDDDAIADKNCLEKHFQLHKKYSNVCGIRGRIFAKVNTIYNHLQTHYDLGEDAIEALMNIEGNSSFKKNVLTKVGGFNSELFGHEGVDLQKRILKKFSNKCKFIYCPDAIIYHNYADSLLNFIEKIYRHGKLFGQESALRKGSILEFFDRFELKGLFIPRVRYFWRWHCAGRISRRQYIALVIMKIVSNWIRKTSQIIGFVCPVRKKNE